MVRIDANGKVVEDGEEAQSDRNTSAPRNGGGGPRKVPDTTAPTQPTEDVTRDGSTDPGGSADTDPASDNGVSVNFDTGATGGAPTRGSGGGSGSGTGGSPTPSSNGGARGSGRSAADKQSNPERTSPAEVEDLGEDTSEVTAPGGIGTVSASAPSDRVRGVDDETRVEPAGAGRPTSGGDGRDTGFGTDDVDLNTAPGTGLAQNFDLENGRSGGENPGRSTADKEIAQFVEAGVSGATAPFQAAAGAISDIDETLQSRGTAKDPQATFVERTLRDAIGDPGAGVRRRGSGLQNILQEDVAVSEEDVQEFASGIGSDLAANANPFETGPVEELTVEDPDVKTGPPPGFGSFAPASSVSSSIGVVRSIRSSGVSSSTGSGGATASQIGKSVGRQGEFLAAGVDDLVRNAGIATGLASLGATEVGQEEIEAPESREEFGQEEIEAPERPEEFTSGEIEAPDSREDFSREELEAPERIDESGELEAPEEPPGRSDSVRIDGDGNVEVVVEATGLSSGLLEETEEDSPDSAPDTVDRDPSRELFEESPRDQISGDITRRQRTDVRESAGDFEGVADPFSDTQEPTIDPTEVEEPRVSRFPEEETQPGEELTDRMVELFQGEELQQAVQQREVSPFDVPRTQLEPGSETQDITDTGLPGAEETGVTDTLTDTDTGTDIFSDDIVTGVQDQRTDQDVGPQSDTGTDIESDFGSPPDTGIPDITPESVPDVQLPDNTVRNPGETRNPTENPPANTELTTDLTFGGPSTTSFGGPTPTSFPVGSTGAGRESSVEASSEIFGSGILSGEEALEGFGVDVDDDRREEEEEEEDALFGGGIDDSAFGFDVDEFDSP